MFEKTYYVYILATSRDALLYIGMTNSLVRRTEEHRAGVGDGFAEKFRIHKLVYYECFSCVDNAISREKQLKRWSRKKKDALIEQMNPEWNDLWNQIEKDI